MADPTPIQQRIELLAETQGAKEVARELDKLDARYKAEIEQTERSAQAARRKEQQSTRLAAKLRELVAEQAKAERETRDGVAQDNRAVEAARRREQQVERLSRALAVEEDRQDDLNRRVRESISSHRAAAQATDETGQANERTGLSVGKLSSAFGALGIGLTASGGLMAALRLYREELEQIERVQERVFQTQVTLASAERSLKLNLAGASDADVDKALKAAREIASETGIPLAQSTLALADSVSARGGNLDEAIGVTRLGARIRPDKPDEIAGIAGAIGDIQNATGAQTPEEALGFLLTVGSQSRVSNFAQQARNIPAAVTGAVAEDFTGAGAGALFSALSVATADLTGESTRTATINLATQIDEFFDARGRSEQGAEAIFALQNDPALAQEFVGELNLEARALGPARALVSDPGSPIAQSFRSNYGQYGDSEALRTSAQTQLERLESGELEANAQLQRDLSSVNDQLEADNITFGTVGAIRDQLVRLLENSGNGALATKLGKLSFDLQNFSSPEAALDYVDQLLEDQAQVVRSRALTSSSAGTGAPGVVSRRALNSSERRAIETLNRGRRIINDRRGVETPAQFIEHSTLPFGTTGPGGPSTPTRDFEIDDPELAQPNRQSAAPRILNQGTMILNTRDPLFDDLHGEDRFA